MATLPGKYVVATMTPTAIFLMPPVKQRLPFVDRLLTDIGLRGKQIDSLRLQVRTLKAPRRKDAC